MRSGFGFAIVGLALAGSAYGAAAQYYPPSDYPPAPVPVYRDGPPVYRDSRGVPIDPRYVQPAPGEEVYDAPPVGRPFFPPQPLPVVTGGPIDRPPGDVATSSGYNDVTGSVRGGAPVPPPGYAPGGPADSSAAPPRAGSNVIAALPPEDQPEQGPAKELPQRFHRQIVDFSTNEPAGTIIIDTPNTYLYFVLGNGKAIRYGVGVGRDGFTWSGIQSITKKAEWPDWTPPPEMIQRQPYLPRQMAGGPGNPLGARAMYLGGTVYRIHGTNAPETIGTHVSSGCIRLTNEDVSDLYSRVKVGTKVVVLPMTERRADLATSIR